MRASSRLQRGCVRWQGARNLASVPCVPICTARSTIGANRPVSEIRVRKVDGKMHHAIETGAQCSATRNSNTILRAQCEWQVCEMFDLRRAGSVRLPRVDIQLKGRMMISRQTIEIRFLPNQSRPATQTTRTRESARRIDGRRPSRAFGRMRPPERQDAREINKISN